MEISKQYLTNIHTLLDTLMETQSDAIDRAVAAVADTGIGLLISRIPSPTVLPSSAVTSTGVSMG